MILYVTLVGLVLVLSTVYVLRRRSGSSSPPPPQVPYWVPFVGNALEFGRDSQSYLQRCQKQYGDAFRLKMMGQDYVFVLDPFSFPNVFREEKKNISFLAIVKEFACKCFGASEDEFEKQNHETVHRQFITYLQGLELPALTTRMREQLERAIKEKTQPQLQGEGTSWQDGQMWGFVMEVLYVAGTRAFFGDTFEVEQSYKDFFAFDENFPAFTVGVPDFLLGKSVQARKRMNEKLVQLTDPTASRLMIERERYLVEETTIPTQERSRLQFATFWAAHGNTLPSAFWSLAYILSDERAKREITEEVFSLFHKKDTGRETFAKLKDMVKLESAINEALRLSSASIIVRQVMHDFTLKLQNGNEFFIKKGQKMAMYPYIIHNNPEIYADPHKYQFDRFLVEDEDDAFPPPPSSSSRAPLGGGLLERVESEDVLHIKHREFRQLRESRRRDHEVRNSRQNVVVAAAATAGTGAGGAVDPTGAGVDTNSTNNGRDAQQVLRESREQTLQDLRASGRLFSRILRESQNRAPVTASESAENDKNVAAVSPLTRRASTPHLGREKQRQKETEEEKEKEEKRAKSAATNNKGLEQEQEMPEQQEKEKEKEASVVNNRPTTPTTGRKDRRLPLAAAPLQEQLSSSGELDLASPLFLRRAQRMRVYTDDADVDNNQGPLAAAAPIKNNPGSPLRRPSISILVDTTTQEEEEEKKKASKSGVDTSKTEDRSAVAEEDKVVGMVVPSAIKRSGGLRSSNRLLNVAALSKRERSVSLSVIPQQANDAKPHVDESENAVDNDAVASATSASSLSPPNRFPSIATDPVTASSTSTATAGLVSPRQHLLFKKRERTGSFNIPGDHRFVRKEKKFYYKGRELRYHLMPFGGGTGMCPGRYFARNELKLFVSVMIYYFDIELIPDEKGEIKLPPLDETRLGIGILPPATDLPFRFRLREDHLADFQPPSS